MHKGKCMVNILSSIHQEVALTHHEVVDHSEQCIQEPLSSWEETINEHDIERERFKIYPQECRTGSS